MTSPPRTSTSPRARRAPRGARGATALAVLPVLALLGGCGGDSVEVPAAVHATDPACATVQVRLRGADELAGLPRRDSTGQSTAAWGDPADPDGESVVLRCGVEPLGPTTDPCFGVDGVDWVAADETGASPWTTYGRVPAVEVTATGDLAASSVLPNLTNVVAGLPQERQCY